MEALLLFDTKLFLLINNLPHTVVTDSLAKLFSGVGTAGLIWLMIGGYLFFREEKKYHSFFLPILAAGATSWILVEQIIKPMVGRVRPTIAMGAIIVDSIKKDFSFPSGHATIAWAMAVVLSRYEPRLARWLYLLAFLISLSRIYLGVHFPIDVCAGGVLGWCIGRLVLRLVPNHLARKV